MVDGVKLIPVPSSYLPTNVAFLITHPVATVAAEKLTEYKINNKRAESSWHDIPRRTSI